MRVVKETLSGWPDGSIGILVRSRGQAAHTVAALRAAGIELAANDLVELGRTGLASDLLAITRALVHAGDRLAWLTVLRSPLCGLSLADLACLGSAPGPRTPVRAGPGRRTSSPASAPTGRPARHGSWRHSSAGLARLGQIPLRDVVEGIWLELGGPALAGRELPLADLILDEIGRHDAGGDCADVLALGRALDRTRASLPGAGARVQVMTIHKAKGLEFDTVIVPALGRGIRREDRPALLWQELPHDGALDLLLAPINASGADVLEIDGPTWEFRSDVVREVAYQTLTKLVRAQRHNGTAAVMSHEQKAPIEQVAHHARRRRGAGRRNLPGPRSARRHRRPGGRPAVRGGQAIDGRWGIQPGTPADPRTLDLGPSDAAIARELLLLRAQAQTERRLPAPRSRMPTMRSKPRWRQAIDARKEWPFNYAAFCTSAPAISRERRELGASVEIFRVGRRHRVGGVTARAGVRRGVRRVVE